MHNLGLRILVSTYAEAFLEQGGGEHEIHEIKNALEELGVRADLYGPQSKPLRKYDAVLHFSTHGGGLPFLQAVKAGGKRIVLWPNVWLRPEDDGAISVIKAHMQLADRIVFRSQAELNNLRQYIMIPDEKIVMIQTGVRSFYSEPAEADLFRSMYQLSEYILWLGLIEPRKNQLAVIKALKDCPIPLVFAGGYRDKNYYDACVEAAPAHFRFLPQLTPKSEMLRSALQQCKVYIEIPLEPAGLSAIEAGLAGAPLVLSDDEWSREHFGSCVEYVDPQDSASIALGVANALRNPRRYASTELLQQRHLLPSCIKSLISAFKE